MAWILKDNDDRAIISEIAAQSDRGAIVIAGSFLERRLETAIKLCLIPDIGVDLNGKIFKGSGPLATFSAKIDIGFLLQLYPPEMLRLLHGIRDLRNDAAHEVTSISFELPSIKDRTNHYFKGVHDIIWAGMQHHMAFIRATRKMPPERPSKVLHDDGFEAEFFSLRTDPEKTRDKFNLLIKIVLFHLHQVSEILEQTRLVLPPPLHDKPA
jgi:hypothetical protein